MTSEVAGECFVYITLPGATSPVTAGRYARSVDRRGVPAGRFVYGRSYLKRPNAVALDPVELKLGPRTYATASMGGVFGALRDANPDDHPRNHAVIARDADWDLAPACDLTPATPVSLERRDLAMQCGDAGRQASAANLLTQSARFLLDAE